MTQAKTLHTHYTPHVPDSNLGHDKLPASKFSPFFQNVCRQLPGQTPPCFSLRLRADTVLLPGAFFMIRCEQSRRLFWGETSYLPPPPKTDFAIIRYKIHTHLFVLFLFVRIYYWLRTFLCVHVLLTFCRLNTIWFLKRHVHE